MELRVAELRAELKSRGLPHQGLKKADLAKRLREAVLRELGSPEKYRWTEADAEAEADKRNFSDELDQAVEQAKQEIETKKRKDKNRNDQMKTNRVKQEVNERRRGLCWLEPEEKRMEARSALKQGYITYHQYNHLLAGIRPEPGVGRREANLWLTIAIGERVSSGDLFRRGYADPTRPWTSVYGSADRGN
jgi:hypothetical protein